MKQARLALSALLLAGSVTANAADGAVDIKCRMDFTLSGWSAFYKTADGQGTVECSDGSRARVALRLRGGGVSFGRTAIDEGHGTFTRVYRIDEVFGAYAAAGAHAGAGESAAASVYTKGIVSLAVTARGRGMNVGVDFGRLTISRLD